jgi:hypothetical protein
MDKSIRQAMAGKRIEDLASEGDHGKRGGTP